MTILVCCSIELFLEIEYLYKRIIGYGGKCSEHLLRGEGWGEPVHTLHSWRQDTNKEWVSGLVCPSPEGRVKMLTFSGAW